MTPPRLRTRLTLWFVASILLIVTPLLVVMIVSQWRAMRAALDHHLGEDLEVASQMLVAGDGTIAWRSDATTDPGYDAAPQRWVEVYSDKGRTEYLRGLAARDDISDALEVPSAATEGYRTFTTPAGAYVRSLTARRTIGSHPYWIRVVRTEDDLRADLQRLVVFSSIIAPLAVLVAALAGHVISGRALAPLARMAERARVISADRLSERLPVENPDDELGQLATVFNETFARLGDSFGRLKRFTADASHELRTPLTAIRSVGEVGLREARTVEAYREIVGSMLEEADHLATLVDRLLTLSRWESGRVKPSPSLVDVRQVAIDAVAQLSVLAEDRGLTVDIDIPEAVVVLADATMVRQALVNVLDNAIKYTREGGRIRVSGRNGAECRIVVDDEGPGIPAHERRRVLERFYRSGAGRQRVPAGTGLGLAIVHWAMTASHGRIEIDDSDLGGARIVLSWPRPAQS